MKDFVNILFSIIDKIDNWENTNFLEKKEIINLYISQTNNEQNFINYFDKYRLFLSKNAFNNLSKDIITF